MSHRKWLFCECIIIRWRSVVTSYRRDVIGRARKLVGKWGKILAKSGQNVPIGGIGQQFRGHSSAVDNYCRDCSDVAVIGHYFFRSW